jgi:5,5'-dehydrodivanillate O-demethylase
MLTAEQNERLTRVGPGTPAGELLRRYWHPIAATVEMAQHTTKAVRLLGEDLVLYRDESGQLGLIGRYCAHRLTDLVYGMPDRDGLRCPYHGWKYDASGCCTEQPFEEVVRPDGFKNKVKLAGYPVEELGGLIFAYLGPQPAPLLPLWDVLVDPDAQREIGHTITNCNWLQTVENALDPVHVEWLHGEFRNYARKFAGTAQRTLPHARHLKIDFDLKEHGIIKRRLLEGESEDHDDWRIGHWMVFPNMQKGSDMMRFRIPRDDYQTAQFYYTCRRGTGSTQRPEDIPLYEMPSPTLDRQEQPVWEYLDNKVDPQDNAIFVGQGAIMDRTKEMLGESDRGIILFRKLLEDQIKLVETGRDPMNVFRDAAKNGRLELPAERREHFLMGRTAV